MKIDKKSLITTLLVVTAISSLSAFAATGDETECRQGPGNPESREEVKTAIESGDYDAFIDAIGDGPLADIITEENFDLFIEAHDLRESGDKEGAKEILDELGITPPREFRQEFREDRQDFLENLTEDQKEILEQAKELHESGQHDEAKELLEENGITPPERPAKRFRGQFDQEEDQS